MSPNLPIPDDALREFCEKHHIRTLKLFGSALRDDFTPQSDIDLLLVLKKGLEILAKRNAKQFTKK